MGSCCLSNTNQIAEEFVLTQLKNPSLKLKEFDYNRLLNEIVSKRVQQEVYKEHIEEYLLEEFYNTKLPEEEKKYSKAVLEQLITHLKEKNNMYVVMLIFYPLINHENEKCDENLYSMFNYISGRLTINEFEVWLFKYFYWNTFVITNAIAKVCNDPVIKHSLEELNISFYNEVAIRSVVNRILNDIKSNSKSPEKDLVSKEQFKLLYQENPFAKVEDIRALVSNIH